jgi:SSS family solute:Na+ symporter
LIVIIAVTLLTPPERIETLREFYHRCRPPGWWGPVANELDADEWLAIRQETIADLIDCALGIAFAASAILAVISPLGRHWLIFVAALSACAVSGGLFIARWARRGVFRSLSAEAEVKKEGALP